MAGRDLFGRLSERMAGGASPSVQALAESEQPPSLAPLGGTRGEAVQRLQIGLTGLCVIIFVTGIASVIGGQADIAEDAAVPDAAPTTEPTAAPPQRDPLADAGVVPDIPPEPEPLPDEDQEGGLITKEARDGAVTVPDTPPTEPQVEIDAP
ncbi:MAG: hypothetical protein AAGH57_11015 [Pseudomonadota bacterium]